MVATLAVLLTIDCGHAQTPIPSAAASAPVSGQPTARPGAQSPAPAVRIDLERFTVNGVGLTSTSDEVRSTLGPPQEEQKVSASEELKQQLDEARGDEVPLEKRAPEQYFTRIVYAYFDRGIRISFDEEDMKIYTIEIFTLATPPYEMCTGAFTAAIPLEVRESQLLRPLAKQIYKDRKDMLYLKKDDREPLRETAVLTFSVEGWLTRITFKWEENYDIDLDECCVADVCLGDPAKKALDQFGPPDLYGSRGNQQVAEWQREGLKISARRDSKAISRISVFQSMFDGGFVQPLLLTQRKSAFHDYLKGRIYQEAGLRICAYAKDKPRSPEKIVLNFDEDERLKTLVFAPLENVEVDLTTMTAAGVKVGDPAGEVRRLLGRFSRWRDLGNSIVAGYPTYGMRVFLKKSGGGGSGQKSARKSAPRWSELGNVSKIEVGLKDQRALYSVPLSFADTMKTYEKEANTQIFRRKGNTLYLSRDGRTPNPGVATMVTFEELGWPYSVTFREFSDIVVDLRAFTVAGIGLGTHADGVFRVLGKPERSRVPRKGDLEILNYIEKGITVVIDRLNRSVCKINIDLEVFEGSFAQELTLDSDADDYEKVVHPLIYKQDEKTFWLSPDGKEPTWEEGVIYFSLTGDVKKISFLTLGVKREGILLDITKELE
jgi:hypothetical protein